MTHRLYGQGMPTPTGLLIIRAWLESGSPKPLRATLRFTNDVSLGLERTVTLADADEIALVVRRWLGDIEAADVGRHDGAPAGT